MDKTSFNVPSITCSICSGKIKGKLGEMEGIEAVDINLKSQLVQVAYNPDEITPTDIKKTIMTMGYEVIS